VTILSNSTTRTELDSVTIGRLLCIICMRTGARYSYCVVRIYTVLLTKTNNNNEEWRTKTDLLRLCPITPLYLMHVTPSSALPRPGWRIMYKRCYSAIRVVAQYRKCPFLARSLHHKSRNTGCRHRSRVGVADLYDDISGIQDSLQRTCGVDLVYDGSF